MDPGKSAINSDDAAVVLNSPERYPVRFTGSGDEYFKIWIVNILLSIVTLYIYSAWAKIRSKRYILGNTMIDGSSFEYHAKPLQILLSRVLAVCLFVIVTVGDLFSPWITILSTLAIALVIPWAILRSLKFNMRMTSFRNVRFGFDGSVGPLYLYQFLLPTVVYAFIVLCWFFSLEFDFNLSTKVLLTVMTLLFTLYVVAFTHLRLSRYYLNHYLYGKSRFSGSLEQNVFSKAYVSATVVGVCSFLLATLLVVWWSMPPEMSLGEWIRELLEDFFYTVLLDFLFVDEDLIEQRAVLSSYIAFLVIVSFFVWSLVRASVRNHVFNSANLAQRVRFESSVPIRGLWWVALTNHVLIIVTLGFARPHTLVRMEKFLASHTHVLAEDSLDLFESQKRQNAGALGDELGDAFDVDIGF